MLVDSYAVTSLVVFQVSLQHVDVFTFKLDSISIFKTVYG